MTTKQRVVFIARRLRHDIGNITATGEQLVRLGLVLERVDRLVAWLDPIDGRAFSGRQGEEK